MVGIEVMYVHLKPLLTQVVPNETTLPNIGDQVVIKNTYYNVVNRVWTVTTRLYTVAIHLMPV